MLIFKFIILENFKGSLCSFGEENQITAFIDKQAVLSLLSHEYVEA